jgi:hypothetical protein
MDLQKDRGAALALALAGAGVALLAGLTIAWFLTGHRDQNAPPPAASQAGLVIDSADVGPGRMDTTKPLRCFVAGQPVGELTLAECAKRNGVSTDALDVGVDNAGALAAAQPPALAPPPPSASEEPTTPGAAPPEPPRPAAPAPARPTAPAPPQVISGAAPH